MHWILRKKGIPSKTLSMSASYSRKRLAIYLVTCVLVTGCQRKKKTILIDALDCSLKGGHGTVLVYCFLTDNKTAKLVCCQNYNYEAHASIFLQAV